MGAAVSGPIVVCDYCGTEDTTSMHVAAECRFSLMVKLNQANACADRHRRRADDAEAEMIDMEAELIALRRVFDLARGYFMPDGSDHRVSELAYRFGMQEAIRCADAVRKGQQ